MDIASKASQTRSTDRVLQALSTLAALIDRSINEVKTLDTDFQERLVQAVRDAEASVQNQSAQQIEAVLNESKAALEEQFKKKAEQMAGQWGEERDRLNDELTKVTQSAVLWEAERARLNGELERMARVETEARAEAQKAVMAMKAASAAEKTAKAGASINSDDLTAEIKRVESYIKEISTVIEDPATELSTVIRKNVERAEMASYLKGIQFALKGRK